MQVSVFAALPAEMLKCPVADDLVRIHVGRGTGAALDGIDDELVMQLAGAYIPASGYDGGAQILRQQPEFGVSLSRGLLDRCERIDQGWPRRYGYATDLEILPGS